MFGLANVLILLQPVSSLFFYCNKKIALFSEFRIKIQKFRKQFPQCQIRKEEKAQAKWGLGPSQ